ncbi:MAG: SUMF1/EgtB/PvdO family nonheme iron enzyme, partial [Anaerolineae bacterium]|nr:SUMF1/EgtB/PvdO family nonheme iron enzyme [Anaerolineae bacterium]
LTITDAVGNPVNLSDVGDMAVLEPVLPPEETDLELITQIQATVILSAHLDDVIGAIELSDGRILSWAYDATLRLWDNSGDLIATLSGHTSVIWGAIELSDGRILSWSWDGTLRLWDNDGNPLSTLTGHTEAIRGAVEANNGTIISWAWDNTIRVWDMNGNLIATINFPYEGLVKVIALRNGHILAWGNDNTLIMWDGLGNLVNNLTGHTDIVWDAIELNDGRILSTSQDKTLRLWDNDGSPISTLTGHTDLVIGAIQLTDGRILSYSQDMTLRLWDNTGNLIHTLVGHTFFVSQVIELSDNRILSISTDNTMKLWDATTGELIITYVGHTAPLWRGIALGDGRVLSISDDKMMVVWDINGSPILRLTGHEGFVFAIQLRDGRILSWSNNLDDDIITDTTLRIWDIGAPPLTPEATSTLPDVAVLEPVSILNEAMFSSSWMVIEGGTFNMGTTAREVSAAVEECITRDGGNCTIQMGEDSVPEHSVTLDTFIIQTTEVTNVQYVSFLNWMGANSHIDGCLGQPCIKTTAEDANSYIMFDGENYNYALRTDDFPIVNVTWYGAQAYCQAIGQRLPTEAEWEYAARGSEGFLYPWGNVWDDSLANTRNSNLGRLAPVQSFADPESTFVIFDMAGNAAEWVNDWYSSVYYHSPDASELNPQGPATGAERVIRGGSWDVVPFFARSVHRQSMSPDMTSLSVGFRCASDYAEPSSEIMPTQVVGQIFVAQQDFEYGKMFWFEATSEIWVIFDDESREWLKYQNAWNVTMPISDDTIVPPDGLYQPIQGFGLLWRTDTDLRDRLGWATAQEFGYVTDYLYYVEGTQVYHVIVGQNDISYIFNENNQTWLELENQ